MEVMLFLTIAGAIIFSGIAIQLFFLRKFSNPWEIISLSLPVGMGLSIVFIFLSSPILDISQAFIVFIFLSLLAGLLFKSKLRELLALVFNDLARLKNTFSLELFRKEIFTLLLSATLLVIVGVSFYKNITWPITDWDAITSYDYFAKLWCRADSLNTFKKGILTPAHGLNWPFFNSIMHIFSYWAFGLGNQGKLFYSILLSFFAAVIFVNFRRQWNVNKSLIFTALIVTTPIWGQSLMAYTNFPFSVYFVTSLIYLNKFIQEKDNKFNLSISLIFFFISVWVRNSFYMFHVVTALALAVFLALRKKFSLIPIVLIVLVIFALKSWDAISDYHISQIDLSYLQQFTAGEAPGRPLLKRSTGSYSELFVEISSFGFSGFWEVAAFTFNVVRSGVKIYLILYLVVVFYTTDYFKKMKKLWEKGNFLGCWIDLSLIALFAGIWISSITMYRYWDQISGSAVRMISFLPPTIVYYILTRKGLVSKTIDFLTRLSERFQGK